jgi:hypothetical protein
MGRTGLRERWMTCISLYMSAIMLVIFFPTTGSCSCLLASFCYPAVVERDVHGVSGNGVIDQAAVDRADELLQDGDDLTIGSVGGMRMASIAFGRIVIQKNIRVIVETQCLSACAMYVLLPAKRKSVSNDADVLFHSPALLWVDAVKANPKAFSPTEVDAIDMNAREERELYESAGIDISLLKCVEDLEDLNFSNIMRYKDAYGPEDHSPGEDVHAGGGRYNWVAFSAHALRHYGVTGLEHYWIPVSLAWRRGPTEGGKAAFVDGGRNRWCRASPGEPGFEPDAESEMVRKALQSH